MYFAVVTVICRITESHTHTHTNTHTHTHAQTHTATTICIQGSAHQGIIKLATSSQPQDYLHHRLMMYI